MRWWRRKSWELLLQSKALLPMLRGRSWNERRKEEELHINPNTPPTPTLLTPDLWMSITSQWPRASCKPPGLRKK